MRILEAAMVAVLALSLGGCVIGKKPQTAAASPPPPTPAVQAPPPEPAPSAPLSTPQTQVMLPKYQPLTNEAITSAQTAEEVPYTPPVKNGKNSRGGGRPATQQSASAPRPETPVQPAGTGTVPPPVTPPATVTAPVESPDRPIVQEIVTPAESERLKADTLRFRQEIIQRLAKLRRHLTTQQEDMRLQINSLVKGSDQALQQSDPRKAYELASKGLVLAKALSDAR